MKIITSDVRFAGNGDHVPGYLARPEGEGTFPAVVVLQEWWGLNDHIKDVTRRFAEAGFVALAPDLYRGQIAREPDEARKLAMELERPDVVKDIQGAVDYLIEQPFAAPAQVWVVGFCMGGGLASWMAMDGQQVGAVVVFYGARGELTDEMAEQISAPFLGLYGEADSGIPLELVRTNESMMKKHHKICEFVIYPDAPHAFFNNERVSYRKEAAEDAWGRTLNWFNAYLR